MVFISRTSRLPRVCLSQSLNFLFGAWLFIKVWQKLFSKSFSLLYMSKITNFSLSLSLALSDSLEKKQTNQPYDKKQKFFFYVRVRTNPLGTLSSPTSKHTFYMHNTYLSTHTIGNNIRVG